MDTDPRSVCFLFLILGTTGVHVVYTPSPTSRSVLEGGGVRHVAEPKRGTDGRFVDVSHGGQSELLGLFEWETLHLFRRVDRILKLVCTNVCLCGGGMRPSVLLSIPLCVESCPSCQG